MESVGARTGAAPIRVLEAQIDFCLEKLEQVCNEDVTEFSDNVDKLRELAKSAKQAHLEFESISKKLFEKYNATGAIFKSEEIRGIRQSKRKDCHDFVCSIKHRLEALTSDEISNIDSKSNSSYRNERCVSFVNDMANSSREYFPTSENVQICTEQSQTPPPQEQLIQFHYSPYPENVNNVPNTSREYFSTPIRVQTPAEPTQSLPPAQEKFIQYHSSSYPVKINCSLSSTCSNTQHETPKRATTQQPTTPKVTEQCEHFQTTSSAPMLSYTLPSLAGLNINAKPYKAVTTARCTTTYSKPQYTSEYLNNYFLPPVNNSKSEDSKKEQSPSSQNEATKDSHIKAQQTSSNNYSLNHQQQSLIQEINKITIDPFDGSAHTFSSWYGRIQQKINSAPLTPLQILLLLQENTTGSPRKMVKDHISSRGEITLQDVEEICRLLKLRYGSSSKISEELMSKLKQFPSIRGSNQGNQLHSLYDLCKIINFNIAHNAELQFLNISEGLKLVRSKLPEKIQEEWRVYGQYYKVEHNDNHPPFSTFIKFLERKAMEFADNDFTIHYSETSRQYKKTDRVMKTNTNLDTNASAENVNYKQPEYAETLYCPLHDKPGHTLTECKAFIKLPLPDKKRKIFEWKACFKCLGPHFISNCSAEIKCDTCNKEHLTIMHDPNYVKKKESFPQSNRDTDNTDKKRALCMTLCSDPHLRKNCSKVVLVDLSMPSVRDKTLRAYAILDDQSNTSLVDERVVDFFGKEFPKRDYTLNFASQKFEISETGYLVTGLQASCINTKQTIVLPPLLSTTEIANTKHEVADPKIVKAHPHIKHLASHFNEYDEQAEVLLLIGRDCGDAMLCENYSTREPYAYKTPLGWTLVGETCILDTNIQSRRTMKTAICSSNHFNTHLKIPSKNPLSNYDPFETASDDDEPGLSRGDQQFIEIMSNQVKINEKGNIELPIPFHEGVTPPNNKSAVFHRTKNTLARLEKQPEQLQACLKSIKIDIEREAIQQIPPQEQIASYDKTCWLPVFTVFNQRKNKTRMVYDASAKYCGKSLNDCMYQGPDFNNTLRGVLLRFRENQIGFISDVEKMFNSFALPTEQRDSYRFFWYKDNDPSQGIQQYRSTCHIFGSKASPAIANFGLKYTVTQPIAEKFPEAIPFIQNGFYVDDGIYSTTTVEDAVKTIDGAIKILKSFNIRLHKILCSSTEVLKHFPASELATGTHSLENKEASSTRTLGVGWDPIGDNFYLKAQTPDRPFTKRGIISIVNSLYDPIGIASPVVLSGRLIQRAVLSCKDSKDNLDWDELLPEKEQSHWMKWTSSLNDIEQLKINRCFIPTNFKLERQELHVYADASEKALGYCIYMRSKNINGNVHVTFVEGNSRVAPRAATTMPRLELCAAVEASHGAFKIVRELSRKPDSIHFYSDSQIVLGYISNTEKRFANYVTRRINTILKYSSTEQWYYVSTNNNPADVASRPQSPQELIDSHWVQGPPALWDKEYIPCNDVPSNTAPLPEVKENVVTLYTSTKGRPSPLNILSSKISSLHKVVNVVAILMKFINKLDVARQRLGISLAPRQPVASYNICLNILIKNAQQDSFPHEMKTLNAGNSLPESSKIIELTPFIDSEGIMRVGGRLKRSSLSFQSKHPALLPSAHPLTIAILKEAHEHVNHQGRCLTHSTVRQRGYHILGGRQLINNFVRKCVVCRKLRGRTSGQLMADLPEDRVDDVPPFCHIGMDVFGPYLVHDGITTRRSKASKKAWVLIIVCLVSRAVHLELLPSMDTSSFINAFSRFTAVRGVAKLIRSDRGTNFICGRKQLQPNNLNDAIDELRKRPSTWLLNPPGASHFAGSWERKIFSVKSVLEASFLCLRNSSLSRDELSTLLQEAAAIVNNTPLVDVSSYPDDPMPITPANLLTLKLEPNPPPLNKFSEEDILSYGKRRWRRVQQLSEEFWHRWKTEYLSTLQLRRKWTTTKPNVSIGDVVIIKQKNAPRNSWPLGKISEVKHSDDGLVRSVTLKLPPLCGNTSPRYTTKCIHDIVVIFSSTEPNN